MYVTITDEMDKCYVLVSIRRKRTFIIEVNTFLLDLVGNSTYVLFIESL